MAKKKKAELDRSRPFATIFSIKPGAAFSQDGILFDSTGLECGRVAGYEAAKEAVKTKVAATKRKKAAARAEAILGDLNDPSSEAQAENAAAKAAEEKAAED
jgi:hypothetical protein